MGYREIFNMLLVWVATTVMCHADQPSQVPAQPTVEQSFVRIQKVGLPNAIQVRPNLISGGQPTSKIGFRSLTELGIKTIVSVDGIQPDLKSAKKFGIRSIHRPMSYREISAKDAEALAHVILNSDGPIYIHCHHGKHRSPAATAVACVMAGFLTNDMAFALLKKAGTGSQYRGLFQAVADARPVATLKLMQLNPQLPEQADVGQLVEIMVQMDEDMMRLEVMLKNSGRRSHKAAVGSSTEQATLTEHATLLTDNFSELLRRPATRTAVAGFRKSLVISQQTSKQLQRLFELSADPVLSLDQVTRANSLLDQISGQCHQCHDQFRQNLN